MSGIFTFPHRLCFGLGPPWSAWSQAGSPPTPTICPTLPSPSPWAAKYEKSCQIADEPPQKNLFLNPQALTHPIQHKYLGKTLLKGGRILSNIHSVASDPSARHDNRKEVVEAAASAEPFFTLLGQDDEQQLEVPHSAQKSYPDQDLATFLQPEVDSKMIEKEGGAIKKPTTLPPQNYASPASSKDSLQNKEYSELTSLHKMRLMDVNNINNNNNETSTNDLTLADMQSADISNEKLKQIELDIEDELEKELEPKQSDLRRGRSSFKSIIKPREFFVEKEGASVPRRDILEDKLASLQRRLDTALKELETSKAFEAQTLHNHMAGQPLSGGEGGLIKPKPRTWMMNRANLACHKEPQPEALESRTKKMGEGARVGKNSFSEKRRGTGERARLGKNSFSERDPIRFVYFV